MRLAEPFCPPVDLRQLHHFVAIAEHGSISSAAVALGIAQPSLSEHLSRLEKRLGTQLLMRGARGVQLTEAGVSLARSGREILQKMDLAVRDMRQFDGTPQGVVSVGFPPSLSMLLTVPLVETIQLELPDVKLQTSEAMSGDLLDWVGSGRLDFGYVYDMPQTNHLISKAVMSEELFLVAASDNWSRPTPSNGFSEQHVALAALHGLPLVLPSKRHSLRNLVEHAARSNGLQLNIVAEIDSLHEIIAMVDRASAYTILPHAAVCRQISGGNLVLVEIEKPSLRRSVHLIRARAQTLSQAALAVEQTVSTIIAETIVRYRLRSIAEERP